MSDEKKVYLKQRRPHKTGFRLGRHLVVLGKACAFMLNEKEQNELKGKGPQAWLKEVTEEQATNAPKSNSENKELMELKKPFIDRYDFSGEETLEELKEIVGDIQMYDGLVEKCEELGIEVADEDTTESLEEKIEDHNIDSQGHADDHDAKSNSENK